MIASGAISLALVGASLAGPLESGDCGLCHTAPGLAPAPRDQGCASCHAWIQAVAADPVKREKARGIFPLWDRYEQTVGSYLHVPDLQAASRLQPEWLAAWLADPHDVRPNLPEGMPRFGLTEAERRAVATTVASWRPEVPSAPRPERARVERGAEVFKEAGCPACHTFGRLHTEASVALAPDLIHTRARMEPDVVSAWLRDPRAFSPAATMPTPDLTEDERLAVRDYVLLADADAPEAVRFRPSGGPTGASVTWSEVESRITGRVCVHCHMDPAQNDGRAGPGTAGGFGWAASGIELQTYESVREHGDAILAAIRRRQQEEARDTVHPGERPATLDRPDRPGMPLGLPALSAADVQLLVDWYAAGAPDSRSTTHAPQ